VFLFYTFNLQSQLQFLQIYLVFRIIKNLLNKRIKQRYFLNIDYEILTRVFNCFYYQIFLLRFKAILRNISFFVANIINVFILRIFDKIFFKIIKKNLLMFLQQSLIVILLQFLFINTIFSF